MLNQAIQRNSKIHLTYINYKIYAPILKFVLLQPISGFIIQENNTLGMGIALTIGVFSAIGIIQSKKYIQEKQELQKYQIYLNIKKQLDTYYPNIEPITQYENPALFYKVETKISDIFSINTIDEYSLEEMKQISHNLNTMIQFEEKTTNKNLTIHL